MYQQKSNIMKPTNIKLCTLAIVSLILSVTSIAQNKTDEEAVKACLENYMSGDGDRMEKAFHPSATMKYIDAQSGEFKDIPIVDFIARVKSNTAKQERKLEIIAMNIDRRRCRQWKNKDRNRKSDTVRLYEYAEDKRRVEDSE
jgi:hypothetical protein